MCNVSFLIATELMSISDVCQIAEKLEKLSPECLENVANKLQKHVDEKRTNQEHDARLCEDKSKDKRPLHLLLDWEGELKNTKKQPSGKELAKLFMELAKEMKNDYEKLESAARRLDPSGYS